MELLQHLDQLNYHEAWIGEHHSGGFEIIASPEMFIAAAAERTRHIRLGTGVVSLPYHNPFMLADRMVQLDHMTRGRAMFGVGPGALVHDAPKIGIKAADQRRPHERIARRDHGAAARRDRSTRRPTGTTWSTRSCNCRATRSPAWRWRWPARARRPARWPRAGTASACCRSAAPSDDALKAHAANWAIYEEQARANDRSPTARNGASSPSRTSPRPANRPARK